MGTSLFRRQKAEGGRQSAEGRNATRRILHSAFCLGRSAFRLLRSAFYLLFFLFSILSCTRAESKKPNVLLITLDTFRADHVGSYGSKLGTTSAIDSVAARGIRFQNAESAVPLTLPSHATILSGVLPLHHGLRNNGSGTFPEQRPTLATLLAANGYRTGAFVGAFVLDHRFGLNRGFSLYDDEIPRDPTLGDHLEAERRGDHVVDRALTWLAADDGRPFFAWVHLYDAHMPYAPPEPFLSRYAASPYDGEIAFVDQQVRRLLAALDQRGDRERTIIVIAGDHGEALGEHGELTHGLLLYEATLRVPLIISAPGILKPAVVNTPVSLVDVAPTIAGLMRLPFATAPPLDGRDLSASLRERIEPAVADIYAETEYPTLFSWSALTALRRGNHKLISSPEPELYDLSRDPHESRNILTEERRVMRSLQEAIRTLVATTDTSARPATAPDAEAMAKLASLGYLAGAPASRAGAARPNPARMVPLFRRFEEATWATTGKRLDAAAAILEGLVKSDPENPVFRGSLAKVERQRGRWQRAIELYREAVAFSPGDARGWYNLASAFQESGDMKRAGEASREALRLDSRNPDAHNVLGIAYSAEGDAARALQEFQNAIAIDPRNARAYNNIGNVAREMRRMDEADQAFRPVPSPITGHSSLVQRRFRRSDVSAPPPGRCSSASSRRIDAFATQARGSKIQRFVELIQKPVAAGNSPNS